MNEPVRTAIEKYYEMKDVSNYLLSCKEMFVIPEELTRYIESINGDLTDVNYGEVWPSAKILIDYSKYQNGEFEVSYSSTLMMSKIAPVYYLQHEFQVDNNVCRILKVQSFAAVLYTGFL